MRFDGGIGFIVNVIRDHMAHAETCEGACGALWHISLYGGEVGMHAYIIHTYILTCEAMWNVNFRKRAVDSI